MSLRQYNVFKRKIQELDEEIMQAEAEKLAALNDLKSMGYETAQEANSALGELEEATATATATFNKAVRAFDKKYGAKLCD